MVQTHSVVHPNRQLLQSAALKTITHCTILELSLSVKDKKANQRPEHPNPEKHNPGNSPWEIHSQQQI